MNDNLPDLEADAEACRTARRLCRLFRIERAGGFERRGAALAQRMIERREALIRALIIFQRGHSVPPSAALLRSLMELAEEVRWSRDYAARQLETLRAELELRRGEGASSGLGGWVGGQLLGRG